MGILDIIGQIIPLKYYKPLTLIYPPIHDRLLFILELDYIIANAFECYVYSTPSSLLSDPSIHNWISLAWAVRQPHSRYVKHILRYDPPFNKSVEYETLVSAIQWRNLRNLQYVVEAGACPASDSIYFHLSIDTGDLNIVKYLLSCPGVGELVNYDLAVREAIMYKHYHIAEYFLQQPDSINVMFNHSLNQILNKRDDKSIEMIKYLLKRSDPNYLNGNILCHAVAYNDDWLFDLILADPRVNLWSAYDLLPIAINYRRDSMLSRILDDRRQPAWHPCLDECIGMAIECKNHNALRILKSATIRGQLWGYHLCVWRHECDDTRSRPSPESIKIIKSSIRRISSYLRGVEDYRSSDD